MRTEINPPEPPPEPAVPNLRAGELHPAFDPTCWGLKESEEAFQADLAGEAEWTQRLDTLQAQVWELTEKVDRQGALLERLIQILGGGRR